MLIVVLLLIILEFLKFCEFSQAGTVVAAKCVGGIVIAADSLSVDSSNRLINSRFQRKVLFLSPTTAICCINNNDNSNGGGDVDFIGLFDELRELVTDYRGSCNEWLDARAIAHCTRSLVAKKYRRAHVIIAGEVDCHKIVRADLNNSKKVWKIHSRFSRLKSKEKKMQIENDVALNSNRDKYAIFEILPQGTCIEQEFAVAGTGATLILPMLQKALSLGNRNENESKSSISEQSTLKDTIEVIKDVMKRASTLDSRSAHGSHDCDMWTLEQ